MRTLILPLGFMVGIFAASTFSQRICEVTGAKWLTDPVVSNLLHIPAFGVLAFAWMSSLLKLDAKRPFMLASVFTIGYGIILEFSQVFIPGRVASVTDVGLGAVGVAVALGLFLPSARLH